MFNFKKFICMHDNTLKFDFFITSKNLILLISTITCFLISSICYGQISQKNQNKIIYSFFAETGETEDSFTISGRNFPVKVGSVGLKANFQPYENFYLYSSRLIFTKTNSKCFGQCKWVCVSQYWTGASGNTV